MTRRKIKGKKAWLITWEGKDTKENGRCKVVAVLSPRLKDITSFLRVLYTSEYNFTLGEKMAFGLANKNDMPNFLQRPYRDIYPKFYYGHFPHEYLFARVVKDLRCEDSKRDTRECTLRWTELPTCIPHGEDVKMIKGETPQEYTYFAPIP